MKKYTYNQFFYKGFQLSITCISKSKKDVSKLFDISLYCVNKWCNTSDIGINCSFNENTIYYSFDRFGGEQRYFLSKEEIEKYYSEKEIKNIIDIHREKYPSSIDTYKQLK